MNTPILETDRLILRPFEVDDATDVFECWESDPDVAKYMFWTSHNDIEKTKEWILFELGQIDKEDWYRFAIVLKETNELIGTGLVYYEEEVECWEIGYNLGKKYWGKGYTTEAMKKIIDFAREQLQVSEIVGRYAKENPASGNVMGKLGFKYEKDIPYECNNGTVKREGIQCRLVLGKFNINDLQWTREPEDYFISDGKIEIVTKPFTDLWQRTYYHFRNDNAPVLQMKTDEKYFSFMVKTEFESKHRFDQCGIVMYLDSENWLKASIEYENDKFQHLGSVVTNNGYSDWATTEIDADIKSMWYRFSRRNDDYCIECSEDGITFKQMRICHMWNGSGTIQFGIYACSPEESSFKATFTNMEITECKWLAHDGQQPDKE